MVLHVTNVFSSLDCFCQGNSSENLAEMPGQISTVCLLTCPSGWVVYSSHSLCMMLRRVVLE